MGIEGVKLIEFKEISDDRGSLTVIEGMKDVPFDIKRIFYIYGTDPHVARGSHANRVSDFVMINVCGSSKVCVKDSGGGEREYTLDKPFVGLYIPKMIWKDMYDFSPDSVLLCLSSLAYDPGEYIRDFKEFEAQNEY